MDIGIALPTRLSRMALVPTKSLIFLVCLSIIMKQPGYGAECYLHLLLKVTIHEASSPCPVPAFTAWLRDTATSLFAGLRMEYSPASFMSTISLLHAYVRVPLTLLDCSSPTLL
jgi:hypothetical protein